MRDAQANLDATLRFYRIPEHRHADTPAIELLNLILGQGESSRLNVAVVRREKAAVGTGSFLSPSGSRNGPGVLAAFGIVNQGVPVARMDEVLKHALVRQPTPIEWEEDASTPAALPTDEDSSGVVAH